jgi:glycosyltransferase involved in cell wall biosynthesis
MALRILYIGNKLAKKGFTPTSIDLLGLKLESQGYDIVYTSDSRSKFFRLIQMLSAIIREKNKVDFVLIDTYSSSAFWFAFFSGILCRIYGLPYIPILHGGNLPIRIKKSPFLSQILFKSSYTNVAVSNYLKLFFNEAGFKTRLIPNSISISNFPFKERKTFSPNLLWVRSFSQIYNPNLAADILFVLQKKYPSATLYMVGPDKDGSLGVFEEYISKLGISNSIKITGALKQEEWVKIANKCDIFINTTNVDNTPFSLIEAMSLGLPVVTTNVGGIPYLIESNFSGLLVNKGDVNAFIENIERLISNPEQGRMIAENARKKAETFSWEIVKNSWSDLFYELKGEGKLLYVGNRLSKFGYNKTSIETLGPQLESIGFKVRYAGNYENRIFRLLEMLYKVNSCKKNEFVLIDTYSTLGFWFVYFVAILCKLKRINYICLLRGGDLPKRLEVSKAISKYIFQNSYKNIAVSEYLQRSFADFGFKVQLIPNNINLKGYEFKLRETFSPKLLWVRSFTNLYNPKMAALILKDLLPIYPEAKLCMVGPKRDSSFEDFKVFLKKWNLESHVTITGGLSKHEWVEMAKDYDIFLNTATIDNTPISVMEAMALGLPVISSNVGGIPYLLKNGEDGICLPEYDHEAFVSAIVSLLENATKAKSIALNARKKVEKFDWEIVKNEWKQLLKI